METINKKGFQLEIDDEFTSEEAKNRDLAWRAFQCGFIAPSEKDGLDVWEKTKLPIVDEYRFFRKNFHKAWVFYTFLLRLITFHNPFVEIRAFWKARNVKRENYFQKHFKYLEYENFESELIKTQPLVSVVIPTLNRYEYLAAVFKDLENQTYTNFEVIVVDQTDDFQEDFYKGWKFDLKFWFQEEKALWKARNEAIKSAKGEFVLMSEDDIRIPKDLIYNHLKAIDFFSSDVSCGVFYPEGGKIPVEKSFFKNAEQFATGNAMLKRELFKKVGLFDRQFEKQRMGDGEFGLRLYLAGYKMISNPLAYCEDVKAPEGGLRINGGSWDGWRPKRFFGPRPVPSVLYLSRKYFGNQLSIWYILVSIMPSLIPYQFKKSKALKLFSFILLPFLLPLVVIQVLKSWKLASIKLKEGNKIEWL